MRLQQGDKNDTNSENNYGMKEKWCSEVIADMGHESQPSRNSFLARET